MALENDEYLKERYQEVKEKVLYKEFLTSYEEILEENSDNPFVTEEQIVNMVVEKYADNENITHTTKNQVQKISSLVEGNGNISIQGRLISISNIKTFTTKKGREGKVANLTVEDETGKVRVVLWTDNMKYMNRIEEGNIIKVNNLEVRKGYQGDLEVQMRNNSTIQVLPEEVGENIPKYEEEITNIADITTEGEYNIIARIIKIGTLREIPKEDRTLELITLTLLDKTGQAEFTLWNKDTTLIESLELKENDTVKVIKARASDRNGQITLTNSWNGRIVKGDYDLPTYEQEVLKLKDAEEELENVTIIGIITKIYDPIIFEKKDGSEGQVRSIEIADDTGIIRATLWNKETEIQMSKGDIIKIEDANIELDDYNDGQYRLNTGWNASIVINPEIDTQLEESLKSISILGVAKLKDVLDIEVEEGREVDVVGRILSIGDVREFDRMDGTRGQVRSIDLGDETSVARTSLWDNKTDITFGLGDAIKIENARTRLGQGRMELSVGRSSRITKPTDEEKTTLPSYEELEKERYNDRTISQLEENEENTKLRVRITQIQDVNTFARRDGSEGRVRGMTVADETGEVQVSLWDSDTERNFSQGAAIIIENPAISMQENNLRLSISNGSNIRQANQEEAELIPTMHEIENNLYIEKAIEDIEEDDKHIKVKGNIQEINGEKIIYAMCPNCNKRITQSEEGYVCDTCGEKIEQPEYLMIISAILEDETGSVQATFFRKEAEELIETTTSEVVEIFEQTNDESSMSSKIEDLIGHEVTIIADAQFNDYNEDIRLNVRKLIIVI